MPVTSGQSSVVSHQSSVASSLFSVLYQKKWLRLLDGLWLLLLAVYIIAGLPIVTFHGDEAMQLYMSRDYVMAFINRQPEKLMVQPPYFIDEDNWLRILNGSINRYAIGLSWHLAGFSENDLPPRPGWDWGLSYERGVETGHRPAARLLNVSRVSSTLFLALSAWVMFAIGWQVGGRLPAYFMSALYALNPVILLNGRRAMMEGSLLFFGMLAILVAILISKNMVERRGEPPVRPYSQRGQTLPWLLLILAGGLTLTSKHSGAVFVAGAWGWVLVTAIIRATGTRYIVSLPITILKLAAAGLLALGLFIALSLALWNDVPARLGDLIEQRQGLLEIQVASDPDSPTTIAERVEGIILQPFMTPPAHYEVAFWGESEAVRSEIAAYMASPLSGLQFGVLLGLPLTLLAGFGLVTLVWPRLRPGGAWLIGLLAWVVVTVGSLLVNPLPWQRYYLPWLPVMTVLAGVGLLALARWLRQVISPLAAGQDISET
ncbi:MAG: hypothetical protein HZC41_00420 [Chloroflexi bacterium]|nr:hypothetical protein [Chloroflexota bacterium]